jgi:hypothetical protein
MTPSTIAIEFEKCRVHHQESLFTMLGWERQVWQTWVLNWITFGRTQSAMAPVRRLVT